MPENFRRAWVEVDLDAIAHNTAVMCRVIAPSRLCAVVKADAYGHGAIAVAKAMVESGASLLAVALVEEGIELREAGITAPILLLSEPPIEAVDVAVAEHLTLTIYRKEVAEAALASARRQDRRIGVHVKIDTGMHRAGTDLDGLLAISRFVASANELDLEGVWTHFAVADDPGDPFTSEQLTRLREGVGLLQEEGIVPQVIHAANSAGAIAHPDTRLDLVRCGIALYGYLPSPAVATTWSLRGVENELEPALSLKAQVQLVRDLEAGERTSYGRTYELEKASRTVVIPLGYRDGVPRSLGSNAGEVLIGGQRRLIAGTITMDQTIVDCGQDLDIEVGNEVVLIGHQLGEQITAQEWADRIGTISYEVLCGIGERVPRTFVRSGRWVKSPVGPAASLRDAPLASP